MVCLYVAVVSPSCRLRLRKWYAQLLLPQKSQLEPASDLGGDFPQSEVTLVAGHIRSNQIRFKSFLQQSTPAPDQGMELVGVVPTRYNEYKDPSSRPDHDSTFPPSDAST